MTREIIFWAMNILGGSGKGGGGGENLSHMVQNGSNKLLSGGVVGEKAH